MGPAIPLCLLLCVTGLAVQRAYGADDEDEEYVWPVQRVPLLLPGHTELLQASAFGGEAEQEEGGRGRGAPACGIECQSALPPPDRARQERMLGYETVYENGTRTQTEVTLRGLGRETAPALAAIPHHARRKRQVYGEDGRFVISDARFATRYPFSAAVRLSTGCSGVLVSPRHVLTSARCVHDGTDYLDGLRKLRVGVLQLRAKRGARGGRRRAGRRRGGGGRRRGEGEEGAEPEEGNGAGGGKPDGVPRRRGGRRGRKGGAEEEANAVDGALPADGGEAADGEQTEKEGGGGRRRRTRTGRVRRDAEPPKQQPAFRWHRVKLTRVPKGWIHAGADALDYDYALLELRRPAKQKHMELGAAATPPQAGPLLPLGRVHFSGFDADDEAAPAAGGGERVVYRFCSVTEASDDLLYQRCDARQSATGAGVYVRLRRGAEGGKGSWERRVIAVFSGHQRLEAGGGGEGGEGEGGDFNVAVRITPSKYAQICHWIQGDPSRCQVV